MYVMSVIYDIYKNIIFVDVVWFVINKFFPLKKGQENVKYIYVDIVLFISQLYAKQGSVTAQNNNYLHH